MASYYDSAAGKYHVNPATGNAGACTATYRCPFGSLDEDHFATPEEARASYETSQGGSFAKPLALPAAKTPTDSYLDADGAREMYARGALVGHGDSPPHFKIPKPLGTSRGFMAGRLYDHKSHLWHQASFTPDGRLAFVDVNRTFNRGATLAVMRWEDEKQDWVQVSTGGVNDATAISETLSSHGYKRTSTGMISAAEARRYRKELKEAGASRPSNGEGETRTASIPRPEKLTLPAT